MRGVGVGGGFNATLWHPVTYRAEYWACLSISVNRFLVPVLGVMAACLGATFSMVLAEADAALRRLTGMLTVGCPLCVGAWVALFHSANRHLYCSHADAC